MEIDELRPGTPIEITLAESDEQKENIDSEKIYYMTSLFDVTNNGHIVFHLPTSQGHVVTVPMNVPATAILNTHKGLFQLDGVITKRGRLEDFPVYLFEPSEPKMKKIQRRDYFRFKCLIPIKALPIPKEIASLPTMEDVEESLEKYGSSFGMAISGTILDISGGGVRFNSKRDIEKEKFLYVSFCIDTLSGQHVINTVARRVESVYREDSNDFEHRIEFLFKDPNDRETIIKYIFNEDRKLRKKDQG